jgi:hypothetical protein
VVLLADTHVETMKSSKWYAANSTWLMPDIGGQ